MRATKDSLATGIFAELMALFGRYPAWDLAIAMAMPLASLDRDASGFENFAENRFGLF